MQQAMVSAPLYLHLLILNHCLQLQVLILQFYNLHSNRNSKLEIFIERPQSEVAGTNLFTGA